MRLTTHLAAATLTLAALPLHAQGVITDGNASFARTGTPWDTTPTADLTGVAPSLAADHLYETGWWYRVAGDTHESVLGTPTNQSYVDNSSVVQWSGVRGLFSATEGSFVHDHVNRGYVSVNLIVYNWSTTEPLVIDVFHFVDFDVAGTNGGETAYLSAWTPFRQLRVVDDAGIEYATYSATEQASAFLVREWGAGDVAALLSDNAITSFDNSGVPFGPEDFTAGWQFPLIIAPSGSEHIAVLLAVNEPWQCGTIDQNGIFCDGFERFWDQIWSSVTP